MHWWKEAKIYELYIDKFAGDINGLIAKLDYFETLGINTLHVLPHFPSPMVDEGYDVCDYRGVRTELGTLTDFEALLKEAHKRNLRIIIDLPLNHTSVEHPWFKEARAAKDAPRRDWYLWSDIEYGFEGTANMFPDIKPSTWVYNEPTQDYYFSLFYPEQADLNWDNDEVFDAMLSIMEFWAALGVAGFRLDAVPHLIKRENTNSYGLPETHALIKRIRARLEKKYPEVILLGETNQSLSTTREYFGDGDECHMCYHFPLMKELWLSLERGDRTRLDAMVEESAHIPANCQWATFLRNHDEITLKMLEPDVQHELLEWFDPEHRFVWKGLQTTAMRVGEVFAGDTQKIMEAFKLLYGVPGAPVMYYGDEIGMRNIALPPGEPDVRKAVRGAFDWQEAQKERSDPQSLLMQTAALIKAQPVATPIETTYQP